MDPTPPAICCTVCNSTVDHAAWLDHVRSTLHAGNDRFAKYSRGLEREKDKHGVRILEAIGDMGKVEATTLLDLTFEFTILLDEGPRINLKTVRLVKEEDTHLFLLAEPLDVVNLLPGQIHNVRVGFNPKGKCGKYQDDVEFIFEDLEHGQEFVIARRIKAEVVDDRATPGDLQQGDLESGTTLEGPVIEGIPPPALVAIKWTVPLPQSPLPPWISLALHGETFSEKLQKVRERLLPKVLDCTTYSRHWKTLLWVEEEQMRSDIAQYYMRDVGLEAHRDHFFLKVPGLAEKRPSIILGDCIKVKTYGSSSGAWFMGHVHEVRDVEVGLRFHPSFTSSRKQRYEVHLELGRLPLRTMHQALDSNFFPSRVLFPTPEHVKHQRPTSQEISRLRPINRLILTNPPQLLAVASIVYQPPGSAPFVVFGPPGTGKTTAIVEAIRRILIRDPGARILACAPGEGPSDNIAQQLTDLGGSTTFPLNAPTRPRASIPRALLDFSTLNNEGNIAVPPLETMEKFRAVVSTCSSAAILHGIGVTRGHFTHIFIDQAEHAAEPEVMVAIKLLAGPETNIVLSGDPNQFSPIVQSPIADTLGLGNSYLDRLLARPVYGEKFNGVTSVKLIKNRRNHPAILKFPNEEFYRNEIEPHAGPAEVDNLLNWEELPTPGFPVIFHSIKGQDMRQADSPSFFNPGEVSLVKKYVEALRRNSNLRVAERHIGVISPYNAQVVKIRSVLRTAYPDVKVGSVEEFQGQERRVIIISAVRSSLDYVPFDIKYKLGFISKPQRLNVAITRAQAALVIIGDADVLGLDPLWREFLNYVHQNGGWKGPKIPWNPHEIVDRGAVVSIEPQHQDGENEADKLAALGRTTVVRSTPVDDSEHDEDLDELRDKLDGSQG